jgi:Ca2+-binding RTX toxin-like protein
VRAERGVVAAGTTGSDTDASDIDLIESLSTTANGGVDTITTLGGNDIVIGGRFGDVINAGDGSNLVIGDSGRITAANANTPQFAGQPMTFGLIETIQFDDGGADLLTTGTGNDIVFGGFGNDTINANAGNNIVFGDDGQIDYARAERAPAGTPGADTNASDIDLIESLSTTANGGVDTITTLGGNDIVIGGRFGDTVNAGDGSNVVIGDSGRMTADDVNAPQFPGEPMTFGLTETIQIDDGGSDQITTGTGMDYVLAGFAGDTVTSGDGDDLVFGDNGEIVYTDAIITLLRTTDTIAQTGGDDVIDAGDGNNIVFAGVGSDIVTTGAGSDIVLGDNGTITNDLTGIIAQVVSGDPFLGGSDTISTGDGADLAIGGAQGDTVTSAGGNDILFGDGGLVTYAASGYLLHMESVDELIGGADTLNGGAGNDILIGGQGGDLLYGSLSEDLLFGGNAAVTLFNWVVQRIESDLQDQSTATLFDEFNSLPGGNEEDGDNNNTAGDSQDDVPGRVTLQRALLTVFSQPVPLLDVTVFQKLFNSSVVTPQRAPTHDGTSEQGENANQQSGGQGSQGQDGEQGSQGQGGGQGSQEQDGGQNSPGQGAREQDPVPGQSPTTRPQNPAEELQALLSKGERDGEPLVAMLGVAGLLAGQQPKSRGRKLLDRDAMAGPGAGRPKPLAREALETITGKWFGGGADAHPVAESRSLDARSASNPSGDLPRPARVRRSLIEW